MIKVNYFLLCETWSLDVEGRVSLSNIFNVVGSTDSVAVPPKFTIVVCLTPEKKDLTAGKLDLRIEILKPDGSKHFEINGGSKIPEEKIGKQLISPLDLSGSMRFEEEGIYLVKLLSSGKQLADLNFTVKLNQAKEKSK